MKMISSHVLVHLDIFTGAKLVELIASFRTTIIQYHFILSIVLSNLKLVIFTVVTRGPGILAKSIVVV